MLGSRPHSSRPRRGLLLVSSLLALLALAVSPVSAFADSSGAQYEDALPTATGGNKTPKNEAPAKSSSSNGGAAAPSNQSGSESSGATGGSSGGNGSSNGSSGGGNAATTADGGTGQSAQGNDQPVQSGNTTNAQSQSPGQQPASAAAGAEKTSDDDGGSSPLVPILIAIAALAAVSIGALVVRQRRAGRDRGPVSPKPSS